MERKKYDTKAGWVDRATEGNGDAAMASMETELDDTNIVAYLHYRGFRFKPVIKDKGHVDFVVYGDIRQTMDEMYKNVNVKVLDFIKCLKAVRSSIFNMRKMSEGGS